MVVASISGSFRLCRPGAKRPFPQFRLYQAAAGNGCGNYHGAKCSGFAVGALSRARLRSFPKRCAAAWDADWPTVLVARAAASVFLMRAAFRVTFGCPFDPGVPPCHPIDNDLRKRRPDRAGCCWRGGAQGWRRWRVSRVAGAAARRGGGFPESLSRRQPEVAGFPSCRAFVQRFRDFAAGFPSCCRPVQGFSAFAGRLSGFLWRFACMRARQVGKPAGGAPFPCTAIRKPGKPARGAGSAPIVGAATPFGRRGLKPARANEASPPGVIRSGLSRLHRMKSGCSRQN